MPALNNMCQRELHVPHGIRDSHRHVLSRVLTIPDHRGVVVAGARSKHSPAAASPRLGAGCRCAQSLRGRGHPLASHGPSLCDAHPSCHHCHLHVTPRQPGRQHPAASESLPIVYPPNPHPPPVVCIRPRGVAGRHAPTLPAPSSLAGRRPPAAALQLVRLFKRVVVEQLLYEVHVREEHAPAAVAVEAQGVQRLPAAAGAQVHVQVQCSKWWGGGGSGER